MNNKKMINQFFAITYDNNVYHFIVESETSKIYCCEFGTEYCASMIEIKPNFVLKNSDFQKVYSLKKYLKENPKKITNYQNCRDNQQVSLVQKYIIDQKTLELLVKKHMIIYSYDMAILYNIDPKYACDICFKNNAFKKAKKDKTKILLKQKQGIFR